MTTILLGGRGILGSAFAEHLENRGQPCLRLTPPWNDPPAVAAALRHDLGRCVTASGPTLIVWAAGAGHIGASPAAMRAETQAVDALCEAVRALPEPARRGLSVLFASSAGALFGGHGSEEVTERSLPAPITAYGHAKLRQEQALRRVAEEGGCRVVACRYTNLYGLAAGLLPDRGLVAVAVRATRLRQPMTIYVSPDTRRDLVYSRDAAAVSLRALAGAPAGFSVALVRHGATRTVSEILSVIGHVSGRRVPVRYADRPETRLQPRVLRFARPAGGPDSVRRTQLATAVHRMLRAPMAL